MATAMNAYDDEVVPGDFGSGNPGARRHESRLRVRVMHKHEIGITMRGRRQRLTSALSDDMHLASGAPAAGREADLPLQRR